MKNTIGTLAFYDTFSGLIPCKVVAIKDAIPAGHKLHGKTTQCEIHVKLTANRRAYLKGEEIESNALHIIPRNHISRRKYGTRIIGGYSWSA